MGREDSFEVNAEMPSQHWSFRSDDQCSLNRVIDETIAITDGVISTYGFRGQTPTRNAKF